VEADIRDSTTNNDTGYTGISDALDEVVSMVFFRLVVVDEFFGVLDEDSSLGFSSLGIKRASVDGNLGVHGFSEGGGFNVSGDDKTLEDEGVGNTGTVDFSNTNILHIEVFRVFRESLDTSFSNLSREEIARTNGGVRRDKINSFTLVI